MLKMNELVKRSNTPKSTILYYLKEGLLPEPMKDKPNFHLYDESCIQLIEFIKYLQTNLYATISQIKALFAEPSFDLNNPYESLLSSISVIMGAENETFSAESLCRQFNLSEQELNDLIQSGLINPRHGLFTPKERSVLATISRCDEAELSLLKKYAEMAKALAEFELSIANDAISKTDFASQRDNKLKHLFDLFLVLKPYVFNMQTFNTYQKENL